MVRTISNLNINTRKRRQISVIISRSIANIRCINMSIANSICQVSLAWLRIRIDIRILSIITYSLLSCIIKIIVSSAIKIIMALLTKSCCRFW